MPSIRVRFPARFQRTASLHAVVAAALWTAFGVSAVGQPAGESAAAPNVEIADTASIETLFTDFLHYSRLGRFTVAEAYAQALLARPDLDPVKLVELADKDKDTINTLLILIRKSSIGGSAQKIIDLLQKGEHQRRQSSDRILRNIDLLGGDPQQEFFGRKFLAESGEYAVPHLVQALLDSQKSKLWPRIISALPQIGKPAIRPLVEALKVESRDVRLRVIQALGEIGYPQAVPYLRAIAENEAQPEMTREAAEDAIAQVERRAGRPVPGSPAELYYDLGERYYDEDPAVRSDPRLDTANVWYWNHEEQLLERVIVAERIFGQVMAMRCCQDALRLQPDHAEAIALWLAANTRREHRLGLDVESGDPNETSGADPTRPDVFPRALYFTQAAGPHYAHLVLARAVRDRDSAVALGAVAALNITAGASSLIGTEDYKQPLVQALQFPDLKVRIRAALALGAALPKSQFDGSELVVPVLASALGQTGKEQILVVDEDLANLNRVVGALRSGNREVIGDTSFYRGLQRARTELTDLSALFVTTGISDPALGPAMKRLRGETTLSKAPVVVLAQPRQTLMAAELAQLDRFVEVVDAAAASSDLESALQRVRQRVGQARLDPDDALSLALEATQTLRRIAVDGRTVFEVGVAEPALIGALTSADEELQVLAASVLSLLPTDRAQRAVGHVALDVGNAESLRIAAFGSLAESAKNHGRQLEPDQITSLVQIAREETNLTIRTAASQALGALNLESNEASAIIRSCSRE